MSLIGPPIGGAPLPLTAFCSARLAEEQARAEEMGHDTDWDDEFRSCPAARTGPLGDLPWGKEHCDCGLAARKAKRLREIAAMRAVIFSLEQGRMLGPLATDMRPCEFLAAIWSDHEDYAAVTTPAS